MPQLIVSDANILIDMEHGELLGTFFQLPYEIIVPDTLFVEELEPYFHNLLAFGLGISSLTSESMQFVEALNERTPRPPSVNDMLALGLARQHGCTLLTGDQSLRSLAATEGIDVHGTVWVLEQLIIETLVPVQAAATSYQRMLDAGSHLPRVQMEAVLVRYGWTPP